MTLDLLTPIGLGLLGFIEPCSLGANAIFLHYIAPFSGGRRVAEAFAFILARGIFLGVIGAAAGEVGGRVLAWQGWYIMALGVAFVLLGGLVLSGNSGFLLRFPQPLAGRRAPTLALGLGAVFGLSAPACATPLLVALMARSLPGGAATGFVQLFVFGVAMSAPLLGFVLWQGWQGSLQRLRRLHPYIPYLSGGALLGIGLYGIGSGWNW